MPRLPVIAGADFSAAKKIPNATWLALGELEAGVLKITSLENTGSLALPAALSEAKGSGAVLCGLDFPFSYPLPFLEFLGGQVPFPPLETCTWLELASAIRNGGFENIETMAAKFAEGSKATGKPEPLRLCDTLTVPRAKSPLHKINPGMLKMTFHGIETLLQLREFGFSVLPFEGTLPDRTTQNSVIEVYPAATLRALGIDHTLYKGKDCKRINAILEALQERKTQSPKLHSVKSPRLNYVSLHLESVPAKTAAASHDALDAVLAALAAAQALMNRQAVACQPGLEPRSLALEGWIYTLSRQKR